ncbi:hypothetical protein [Amycolatopsis sp. NPDC102389]|uniref:hypothetical protein n=1 Tax=Amycolatopsis sp. NPDC102389 TaxID=3363941 RepID=UPI003805B04B
MAESGWSLHPLMPVASIGGIKLLIGTASEEFLWMTRECTMKNRTRLSLAAVAFAAAALYAPASANAATATAQAADAQSATCLWPTKSWSIPDGGGDTAGRVEWHDYDGSTDKDNFFLQDKPGDGQSVSLRVKNHATGKEYYKHVYSGNAYCMGVGNIPNGDYVYWSACSWDDGVITECRSGTITE